MQTSEQLNELATALAKAQAEMLPAVKDKVVKGSNFSYSYADLAAVIQTAHDTLAKHGLSIAAPFETDEQGNMTLVMSLMHTSGQRIVSRYPILLGAKRDQQAVGSAVSYARRYAMMALINLPTADDDAQAAMGYNDDRHDTPPSRRQSRHNQSPEQLPQAWRETSPAARPAKRVGRPPNKEPDETSELFQEVMTTIHEAGSLEELSTASELAMGLSDDNNELTRARTAFKARRTALAGAAERSKSDRDSIKDSLLKPA